jgi:DNA-binding NtrC family response regulator
MLYVVAECDRPSATSSRHRLGAVDTVALTRAKERGLSRTGADGTLTLGFPDKRMSVNHALLRRSLGRWVLEDQGSKNGTWVNGSPLRRCVLRKGDVVQTGHTLLLFTEDEAKNLQDLPDDVDSSTFAAVPDGLWTLSPVYAQRLRDIPQIARASTPVWVMGQTGTGKELLARALHDLSARPGPFVAHSCGAVTSGPAATQQALQEAASGTLLLDEVTDLPSEAQAGILRALDEHAPRLICSSAFTPEEAAQKGKLRLDFLARVNGFRIVLPPLSARREDMGALVSRLLRRIAPDADQRLAISPAAMRLLLDYPWPLNIRELDRALQTAVVLGRGQIDVEQLPEPIRTFRAVAAAEDAIPTREDVEARRRSELVGLLRAHEGNVSAIARATGKARMQIQRLLKKHALDARAFRP